MSIINEPHKPELALIWAMVSFHSGPDPAHIPYPYLAQILHGVMALGRSTRWPELALIWATVSFHSGPHSVSSSGPNAAWNYGTLTVR